MRIGNDGGRAVLISDSVATDIAIATKGDFGPSLASIYERWDAFVAAAGTIDTSEGQVFSTEKLGSPTPMPRQVFGIGLNYRSHAAETGMSIPTVPATFTKFPASLSAPFDDIELSSDTVDWEVELVVVIGRRADRVPVGSAWEHVAGLSVGQDIVDPDTPFRRGRSVLARQSYPPTARSDRGSSPPTSSRIRTIWSSAARSTARWSRATAPATWSSRSLS